MEDYRTCIIPLHMLPNTFQFCSPDQRMQTVPVLIKNIYHFKQFKLQCRQNSFWSRILWLRPTSYHTYQVHVLDNLKHSSAWWWLAQLILFPPPWILSALVASTTAQTLMTSKSVSRNWPLASFRLIIYQTRVCLSTQNYSSRFLNPCGNSWMLHV